MRKPLRVNSILDDEQRTIRKPCEARAGHGLIMFVIAIGAVAAVIYGLVKLVGWLIDVFRGA
jgi:hypothetical protein